MNILITGASGFIGENFLRLINKENIFAEDNIILLSSKNIPGYSCVLHKDYTFQKSDFIDADIDHVDVVFHLGASTPKNNAEYGLEYTCKFAMNVRNTIHLVENLPSIPSKFIFSSSVDVYGTSHKCYAIDENSPLSLEDMYSASKIMCEKYLEMKADEDEFILQVLRLSPMYGPGEERMYSKIVSTFIRQVLNKQQINIFSDGSDTRSLLFVEDCCRNILEASNLNEYIGPVNIASSQSITVKALALLIYSIGGMDLNIKYGSNKSIHRNVFDTSKMRSYFGFSETDIKDGLIACYDYYKRMI